MIPSPREFFRFLPANFDRLFVGLFVGRKFALIFSPPKPVVTFVGELLSNLKNLVKGNCGKFTL
jgi:hypothetical protein